MNAVAVIAGVWLTLAVIGALTLWCVDHRDHRCAAVTRHPAAQAAPRGVAIFCGSCGRPVRYQIHPEGRRDAVRLHRAFECADLSRHPTRRNVQK